MTTELEILFRELAEARAALQTEKEVLWKLASNPFTVVGEAHVTDHGIDLVVLGSTSAEQKLGLAPGSYPSNIDAAAAMMNPEDIQPFQRVIASSLTTGEPFDMNFRWADGRGGWRWIEGRAVSVEVRAGNHVRWMFVNRDFTAQYETEQSLRQSLLSLEASRSELKSERDKFWQLAMNAFAVLAEIQVTEQGLALKFFEGVNVEAKIGLKPGTLPHTGDELILLMHPDDIPSYQERVVRSLATGEPFRTSYRLADGYGGWRWLHARAISVEEQNGRHVRWLSDTTDITEQKETEAALRASLAELQRLKAELQADNISLREELGQDIWPSEIIGRSASLTRVLEQVNLVAATTATVLISGETGVGKELIARAIHQQSDRQNGRFVAVNCAALPPSLVESELFGHERGAFTGAVARRIGRFEQADSGTLFLDEVGELPFEAQAKILRALQTGEFERVGGEHAVQVKVRIIAASNRNLDQAVREGRFRSDLYHRLAIFPIQLPPLRERREDIPQLAAYLVSRKASQLGRRIERIAPQAMEMLSTYDWPGNVRELENVLERAIILSPGTVIGQAAIQVGSLVAGKVRKRPLVLTEASDSATDETLSACERAHIIRICRKTNWKIKGKDGAAAILDINPATLFSRMKKLGIQRPLEI